MSIGHSIHPAGVKLAELKIGLIFPAIERWIPKDLDYDLAQHGRGAWHHEVFDLRQILRLELLQACRPKCSFRETLREVWHAWRYAHCAEGPIPSSGAFPKARARLPEWSWERLFKHTAALVNGLPPATEWAGYRVLAIDGTPLTLSNTPANRTHFGTTRHQYGEAYFPQALAVWISHVTCGAVVAEYLGTCREGDETIAPYLLPRVLRPSDLFLGDAHLGTFATLSVGQGAGASFLCRAPGALDVQAHVTYRYAADDADVHLALTPYMRRKYEDLSLPEHLSLRTVAFEIPLRDRLNGTERADFLTNLPRETFPPVRLAQLGRLRWTHETLNNDIKTRLGLGEIRSQTPKGVRREVLAHLCMINILRLMLHEACPAAPRCASFTAALSALHQANQQLRFAPERQDAILALFHEMIRTQPIVARPHRTEPRMIRPNKRIHPVFKTPRADWRAERKVG